jgi:hypothetical protein
LTLERTSDEKITKNLFHEGGELKEETKAKNKAFRVNENMQNSPKNRTLYNKEGGDVKIWKIGNRKTIIKAFLIHFTKEFVK